jgi:hypothetical protein
VLEQARLRRAAERPRPLSGARRRVRARSLSGERRHANAPSVAK